MTTWVVVADSSRGKIYVQDSPSGDLRETEDLVHTGSRLRGSDLTSDRPGSDGGAHGQGRHILDARTETRQHEAEVFAREIAARLEAARTGNHYQKLVLMAPPAFLGVLREQLDDEVRKLVIEEVAKDLVTHSARELHDQLRHVLQGISE